MPRKKLNEGPLQRKDGWWGLRVRESNGRLVYFGEFATRDDAEDAWRQVLAYRQRAAEHAAGLRDSQFGPHLLKPLLRPAGKGN